MSSLLSRYQISIHAALILKVTILSQIYRLNIWVRIILFFVGAITIIEENIYEHTYKKLQYLGDEDHPLVFVNEVRIVQA